MPTSYLNFKKYIGARILYSLESKGNSYSSKGFIKIEILLSSSYFRKNRMDFKNLPFYDSCTENSISFKIKITSFSYWRISWAKASEVRVVFCPYGKYVLKKISNTNQIIMKTQEKLFSLFGRSILPQLIYWRKLHDNQYLQIFTFTQGEHKFGELNLKEKQLVISTTKKFIKKAETPLNFEVVNLHDLIATCYKQLSGDTNLKRIGKIILNDPILVQGKNYLVHYDLHRQNFLLRKKSIIFLDVESIMYAPKDFQAATLFMSCFLLYEKNESFNLNELLSIWGDSFDKKRLFTFMLIRAWIGAAFFHNLINRKATNKDDIRLLNLYHDKVEYLFKKCSYAEL